MTLRNAENESVCGCVCEGCAQPICPVSNGLHVLRGLPKHSALEHQGLLDSMSVCVMMCCRTKLCACDSTFLKFPVGLQGQSQVIFRDCLVLLIVHITLHYTLEYSRGDNQHGRFW